MLAFFVGLAAYFVLRVAGASQLLITGAVVAAMVAYTFVVARVPRLRVRLDQAGDNAYYLGLLFTLVSMAVALHEFGVADPSGPDEGAGAREIIANFGVALASTITGIFLRIVLHQMRVDPADVEAMTRIELAEAAKRVKATLDSVAIEFAHLVEVTRQRSSDQLAALLAGLSETVGGFLARATADVNSFVAATATAQEAAVARVAEATSGLAKLVEQVDAAAQRLAAVEPPPLKFASRLEKTSESLDRVSIQLAELGPRVASIGEACNTAVASIASATAEVAAGAGQFGALHEAAARRLDDSVAQMAGALAELGERIRAEQHNVTGLGEQLRRSTEAANEAQDASVRVLGALTSAVQSVTDTIERR